MARRTPFRTQIGVNIPAVNRADFGHAQAHGETADFFQNLNDMIFEEGAKRAGHRGGLAGEAEAAAGTFEPMGEDTFYGQSYNEKGRVVYYSKFGTDTARAITEIEQQHSNDPQAFSAAAGAYADETLKGVHEQLRPRAQIMLESAVGQGFSNVSARRQQIEDEQDAVTIMNDVDRKRDNYLNRLREIGVRGLSYDEFSDIKEQLDAGVDSGLLDSAKVENYKRAIEKATYLSLGINELEGRFDLDTEDEVREWLESVAAGEEDLTAGMNPEDRDDTTKTLRAYHNNLQSRQDDLAREAATVRTANLTTARLRHEVLTETAVQSIGLAVEDQDYDGAVNIAADRMAELIAATQGDPPEIDLDIYYKEQKKIVSALGSASIQKLKDKLEERGLSLDVEATRTIGEAKKSEELGNFGQAARTVYEAIGKDRAREHRGEITEPERLKNENRYRAALSENAINELKALEARAAEVQTGYEATVGDNTNQIVQDIQNAGTERNIARVKKLAVDQLESLNRDYANGKIGPKTWESERNKIHGALGTEERAAVDKEIADRKEQRETNFQNRLTELKKVNLRISIAREEGNYRGVREFTDEALALHKELYDTGAIDEIQKAKLDRNILGHFSSEIQEGINEAQAEEAAALKLEQEVNYERYQTILANFTETSNDLMADGKYREIETLVATMSQSYIMAKDAKAITPKQAENLEQSLINAHSTAREKWRKLRKQIEILGGADSNNGLNPTSANRKNVDDVHQYFLLRGRTQGGAIYENFNPDSLAPMARIAVNTHIVPNGMIALFSDINNEPDQLLWKANLYQQLTNADRVGDHLRAQIAGSQGPNSGFWEEAARLVELGVAHPQNLRKLKDIEQLRDNYLGRNITEHREDIIDQADVESWDVYTRTQADAAVNEMLPGFFKRYIEKNLSMDANVFDAVGNLVDTTAELIFGYDVPIPQDFYDDYEALVGIYAQQYEADEDSQEKAQEFALNAILEGGVWGFSNFNGSPRIMKYPPERNPDAVIQSAYLNAGQSARLIFEADLVASLQEAYGSPEDDFWGDEIPDFQELMNDGKIWIRASDQTRFGDKPEYMVSISHNGLIHNLDNYVFDGTDSPHKGLALEVARKMNAAMPEWLQTIGRDTAPAKWIMDEIFQGMIYRESNKLLAKQRGKDRTFIDNAITWWNQRQEIIQAKRNWGSSLPPAQYTIQGAPPPVMRPTYPMSGDQ